MVTFWKKPPFKLEEWRSGHPWSFTSLPLKNWWDWKRIVMDNKLFRAELSNFRGGMFFFFTMVNHHEQPPFNGMFVATFSKHLLINFGPWTSRNLIQGSISGTGSAEAHFVGLERKREFFFGREETHHGTSGNLENVWVHPRNEIITKQ